MGAGSAGGDSVSAGEAEWVAGEAVEGAVGVVADRYVGWADQVAPAVGAEVVVVGNAGGAVAGGARAGQTRTDAALAGRKVGVGDGGAGTNNWTRRIEEKTSGATGTGRSRSQTGEAGGEAGLAGGGSPVDEITRWTAD